MSAPITRRDALAGGGALAAALALPASPALAQAAAATPGLRAEIEAPRAVWAMTQGWERDFAASAWRLVAENGRVIPVASVLPNTASRTLIVPGEDLDLKGSYRLEIPAANLGARVRPDGWFRTLYSAKPMGANVAADGASTQFAVFSPRADAVRLYLYDTPVRPSAPLRVVEMARDADGVWEARLDGDLHGTWYDFTVHGQPGPGRFFFETHPVHVSDPYSRVQDEAHGRSRVWRATQPATPLAGGRPKMEDVVAYEVHIEDFTRQLPVAADLQGTIPAFTIPGLRNRRGQPVGFDYLRALGVNVVHLLPMQEFLHYPEDEWQAAFASDPEMQAWGVSRRSYEWGYRTTHAFAIENLYRRVGTEHGSERDQFRDFVQAFHDAGIAVIIDIVPNHTGENMDARNMLFNFNVLDRDYYYRTDDAGQHIGPFGNEVKTEERPMTQRWLLDQMAHLIAEFGIDGFRIDLAGQLDEQTLIAIRQQLGPDVIIYGEPWIDVSDPVVRANPDWDWYKEDAPITFFQDNTRNALVGSPFLLEDQRRDRGYAGGNVSLRAAAMRAIANDWPDERGDTRRGLSYTDIHDNWTLADRFALHDWNGLNGVDEPRYKIAAGLMLTCLGPVVIHGGSEMLRSKGLAPIGEEIKYTATGPIYMKGRHDTYNVRTPNEYVWADVGATRRHGPRDVAGMLDWWTRLIRFRMSETGGVFRIAHPGADHVRFLPHPDPGVLAYVTGGRVLSMCNVGDATASLTLPDLPAGRWTLVADSTLPDQRERTRARAAHAGLQAGSTVEAPGASFRIWSLT